MPTATSDAEGTWLAMVENVAWAKKWSVRLPKTAMSTRRASPRPR